MTMQTRAGLIAMMRRTEGGPVPITLNLDDAYRVIQALRLVEANFAVLNSSDDDARRESNRVFELREELQVAHDEWRLWCLAQSENEDTL